MRCENCSKKKSFLIECKYCNNNYCTYCIELVKHNCVNSDLCKKRKLEELENKLLSQQVKKSKIQKI